MEFNKEGLELIKKFEGLRLKPYLDAVGIPTIGFGNTFYPDGRKVTMKDPAITEKQAEEYLLKVLQKFIDGVYDLVKVDITDNQFSALVSFAYNVGLSKLKTSTLLKLVNQNKTKEASEQFLRWNKANGKILNGLTRRRQAEKDLFNAQ